MKKIFAPAPLITPGKTCRPPAPRYRVVSGPPDGRLGHLGDTRALLPEHVERAPAASLVKRSRTSTVYRLRLETGLDVHCKIDNVRGPADFLKSLVRRSRSLRAWRSLERLRALGFAVPGLVLCGERRLGPCLLRSFLVTRTVEDAVPCAALLESPDEIGGSEATGATVTRRELVDLAAALLRRLHELRVYHADLNPANLLLRRGVGGPRIVLLDADRTRFPRRLSRRRRRKNLAQVNAAADGWATLRDRVRFYRRYDPSFAALPRQRRRRILAEIDAASDRRWRPRGGEKA